MMDCYGREIDYLRVSVTDRCNLRCRYCMPEKGVQNCGHDGVMSFEQIVRLIGVAVASGVRKVRFTGGEPLVRKDIVDLIGAVSRFPGLQDIAITTNGVLFTDMAEQLQQAGLKRVNFSLDSLLDDKFRYITRHGCLKDVLCALDKAQTIGMGPIKINMVVMKGINDDEILSFVKLAAEQSLHVRFIEFMPVGDLPFYQEDHFVGMDMIKRTIQSQYTLVEGVPVRGSGPAKVYQIAGGSGSIGFISAMSSHFCGECNRLRMTADGKLRSCLFDKGEINVKLAIENGASDARLTALFKQAIRNKPARHHMEDGWGNDNLRKMYQIGG